MSATFGDPALHTLDTGCIVDIVVSVRAIGASGYETRALWHDEACLVQGTLLSEGVWTLYGFVVGPAVQV